jgi:hypothetical protein
MPQRGRRRRRRAYVDGYFKVSRRIISSSLWAEHSDVIRVWLALNELAQDPAGPRDGTVIISRPILAGRTLLTPDRLGECLAVLEAPDPASRTADFEGRRIEALPNGFRLLNWDLYHDEAREAEIREARAKAGRLGGLESGKSRRGETLERSKTEAPPEQNEATETETDTDTETTETNERTPAELSGLAAIPHMLLKLVEGQTTGHCARCGKDWPCPDAREEAAADTGDLPDGRHRIDPAPPELSDRDAVDASLGYLPEGRPRIVRPPMTPERAALIEAREAVRKELLAVTMLRGAGDGQRELARASRTPGGQVIVNPESCNSLPWLRTTYERLVARRLELEERIVEDSPPSAPPPPEIDPDAAALFEAVRLRLSGCVDSRAFATWIRPLFGIAFGAGGLIIGAPNAQFVEWVGHNYGSQIGRALVDLGRAGGAFQLIAMPEPVTLHSGSIR